MTALGSISSLLSLRRTPSDDERVAIFSDALNHASIIDGIRLAEKQQGTKVFVYRHCDMAHLDSLLYVFQHLAPNFLLVSNLLLIASMYYITDHAVR